MLSRSPRSDVHDCVSLLQICCSMYQLDEYKRAHFTAVRTGTVSSFSQHWDSNLVPPLPCALLQMAGNLYEAQLDNRRISG